MFIQMCQCNVRFRMKYLSTANLAYFVFAVASSGHAKVVHLVLERRRTALRADDPRWLLSGAATRFGTRAATRFGTRTETVTRMDLYTYRMPFWGNERVRQLASGKT